MTSHLDDPALTEMPEVSYQESRRATTRATNAAQHVATLPAGYQTIAPTHDAPTVREAGAVLIAAGIPKEKVSNILASLHSYDLDKRRWAVAYCKGRIDVSEWHRAWGLSDFC